MVLRQKFQFYKETKFKEILELGIKVPEDWEIVRLGNVVQKIKGKKPKELFEQEADNSLPYLTAQVLRDLEKPKYANPTNVVTLEQDDIVMIWDGSYAGEVFLIKEKGILASTMVKLIPKISNLEKKYLFYWLFAFGEPLRTRRKGTGIPHVSNEIFNNFPVALPFLEEQKAIAEILSTIDKAIEKTQEAIEKTEKLKKGLMQKLLTGEIRIKEENGKWIFYKETEFQDTEIGRIPKEWRVVRLKDVAKVRGTKKVNLDKEEEVAFIPMEKVPLDGLYCQYEIKKFKDVRSYVYCEVGDILLAKITPSFENGKQGIVPEVSTKVVLANTEVHPIYITRGLDKLYLFYLLKFDLFRKRLENEMRGTTGRKRVPKEAIENLHIPFPSLEEQKRIAEVLMTIDKKIELLKKKKELLEKVKKWFMQKLLTGEIRIKVT